VALSSELNLNQLFELALQCELNLEWIRTTAEHFANIREHSIRYVHSAIHLTFDLGTSEAEPELTVK
jgi:hypothetical protein